MDRVPRQRAICLLISVLERLFDFLQWSFGAGTLQAPPTPAVTRLVYWFASAIFRRRQPRPSQPLHRIRQDPGHRQPRRGEHEGSRRCSDLCPGPPLQWVEHALLPLAQSLRRLLAPGRLRLERAASAERRWASSRHRCPARRRPGPSSARPGAARRRRSSAARSWTPGGRLSGSMRWV